MARIAGIIRGVTTMKTNNNIKIRDIRYNRRVPEIVMRFENSPGIIRVPLRSA